MTTFHKSEFSINNNMFIIGGLFDGNYSYGCMNSCQKSIKMFHLIIFMCL